MKKQNKLGTYLAVTAGVGCATSAANAAVVFYGVNSANDTNPDPAGINVGLDNDQYGEADVNNAPSSTLAFAMGSYNVFSNGTGLIIPSEFGSYGGQYSEPNGGLPLGRSGATLESDQNYANISFDGDDDVYEAVAQFYFDGAGGGYLVAIATNNDVSNPLDLSNGNGAALSISAGRAMIDAAAVPEPSSLALLALGSAGLITRRRRIAA